MSERTSRVFAGLPPLRRVTFCARSFVSSFGKCGTLKLVNNVFCRIVYFVLWFDLEAFAIHGSMFDFTYVHIVSM
jgi:hypothetical protein